MNRGRPAPPVDPSLEERRALETWIAEPSTPAELTLRARIVLRSARGESNVAVARALDVTRETVSKWRRRFREQRLNGLYDDPRPGAPSVLCPDDVARVRGRAAEPPPEGGRWTTRALARELGMTQTAVSRILRTSSLEPHGRPSPFLPQRGIERAHVRALAGLYVDPPVRAFALEYAEPRDGGAEAGDGAGAAGDARASADAEAARREPVLARRTQGEAFLERLDAHARKASRHGSGALRWEPFLRYLEQLEARVGPGGTMQVVLAGYGALKLPRVAAWLQAHPRVVTHAIPTSGTWLELLDKWAEVLLVPREDEDGARLDPGRSLRAAVAHHLESETLGRRFRWISPEVRLLARSGAP